MGRVNPIDPSYTQWNRLIKLLARSMSMSCVLLWYCESDILRHYDYQTSTAVTPFKGLLGQWNQHCTLQNYINRNKSTKEHVLIKSHDMYWSGYWKNTDDYWVKLQEMFALTKMYDVCGDNDMYNAEYSLTDKYFQNQNHCLLTDGWRISYIFIIENYWYRDNIYILNMPFHTSLENLFSIRYAICILYIIYDIYIYINSAFHRFVFQHSAPCQVCFCTLNGAILKFALHSPGL